MTTTDAAADADVARAIDGLTCPQGRVYDVALSRARHKHHDGTFLPPGEPMTVLKAALDDLAPEAAVRALVEKVAAQRSVAPERMADYVSLRPGGRSARQ